MKKPVQISALAITLNEAPNLEKYIESLWFANEIIIVDSYSTDNTLSLLEKYPQVTVYQRAFDNFSNQKNFAIEKATNEWVTFFDPDEEISEDLANEILEKYNSKSNVVAYHVKRNIVFMGKRIKYSGFQNDKVFRFFKKTKCTYENLVHEKLKTTGPTETLKTHALHFTYKSFDDYTGKLHHYSDLQADMLYAKNVKPTLYHFLFRPWYRFWSQYILRLGILDGKEGFILAYINAFTVFKRYVKLWLLYRKID